ncbi:hypothetical protein WA158_008038 [Blastocystis sp. Blastoise]
MRIPATIPHFRPPNTHTPVLANEVLSVLKLLQLNKKKDFFIVDGTAGCGGHSKLILNEFKTSKLLCIDRDPTNIPILQNTLSDFADRTYLACDSFSNIPTILDKMSLPSKVDSIFIDIGFNSRHIDEDNRGFSYSDKKSPLDMRYNQREGATCADLVNHLDANDLMKIMNIYGDIDRSQSKFIANKIIKRRSRYPFETVGDLVDLLDNILPYKQVATKERYNQIFQGFRIAVNKEFSHIETLLSSLPSVLSPGGIFICICFHSLEIKLLKKYVYNYTNIQTLETDVYQIPTEIRTLKVLTHPPLTPSPREIESNPRSKSAMLYAFQFL